MDNETQPDPRIGKQASRDSQGKRDYGYVPLVCAVSGKELTGRHWSTYKIADRYYYRAIDGFATHDAIEIRAELSALIPALKSVKAEVKSNDK
jgi:hypothetical protein